MSVAEAFQGLQVLTSALALVSFIAGLVLGDLIMGVSFTLVGFALFSIATAAAIAVVAIEPEILRSSDGRSEAL